MSKATEFIPLGDDFNQSQIEKWFQEEAQFHNTFGQGRWADDYPFYYHYANLTFGLRNLLRPGTRVLDFGCAEGLTLKWMKVDVEYHGVDASQALLDYAKTQNPKGTFKLIQSDQAIPYPDDHFDLILCFGVLHHIPKVSQALREFARVLKVGGRALIREPITDMRRLDGSRPGLSPNERGIHPKYFKTIAQELGLELESVELCYWGPLNPIRNRVVRFEGLTRVLTHLDRWISKLYRPEKTKYQRTQLLEKFAPTAGYYVLRKTNPR